MTMKKRLHWLVLAGLLCFKASAFSQDANFWIFLCFGQSNMEGFPGLEPQDHGPVDERCEVYVSKSLDGTAPDRDL